MNFFHQLGCRLARVSLEPKSLQFLIQRVFMAVQRGNATAGLGTFAKDSLLQDSSTDLVPGVLALLSRGTVVPLK